MLVHNLSFYIDAAKITANHKSAQNLQKDNLNIQVNSFHVCQILIHIFLQHHVHQ